MRTKVTILMLGASLLTMLTTVSLAGAQDATQTPPPGSSGSSSEQVLRAMVALPAALPLPDATLAVIRGAGWADALAGLISACPGTCNIQHVRQVNTNPNGSNVSVIEQRP